MSGGLGDLLAQAGFAASEEPPAETSTEAPAPQDPQFASKVVVRFTRKGRGGRSVTLVSGVLSGREALVRDLKRALGSGARVDGDDIVVQGKLVERVADFLERRGATRVVRS